MQGLRRDLEVISEVLEIHSHRAKAVESKIKTGGNFRECARELSVFPGRCDFHSKNQSLLLAEYSVDPKRR